MKSNASDHLKLLEAVYRDACNRCIADVFDLRDLETLRTRVESEGMSFLTILLPRFCADFERSLANRVIDPSAFQNFRKAGSHPAFLQGMIGLLFNQKTGRMNDETHEDTYSIIESVRQICLTFKKIEIACAPQRTQASLKNYIDLELSMSTPSVPKSEYDEFCHISDVLWNSVLSPISLEICSPRHGPGATAEHISGTRSMIGVIGMIV